MSSPRQGAVRVKTPKTRELETQAKIKRIRVRLEEIAEYKRVLAVDGILPDVDDKRLESELIVRLLYLEKELKNMAPEALALKAREREEEAARNVTVAAAMPLKRRGQSESRRAFDAAPRPASSDAPKKPFAPRAEPWRSPYASAEPASRQDKRRKPAARPEAKPAAARSDRRPAPYAKQGDARSDKRASPYAKQGDARSDKRPSPYAKQADERSAAPRGDKRPSPFAKQTGGRSTEKSRDERPSPYAKQADGRGDRRPSPYAKQADGRSGKGPSPHTKKADGRGANPKADQRPSPYAKKPADKRYARPKAGPDARDESSTLTPAGEKKGYWSRDDRRVRSGKKPPGRPAPKH